MGPIGRWKRGFGLGLVLWWQVSGGGSFALPQPASAGPQAQARGMSGSTRKKTRDAYVLVGAGDIAGCTDLSGAKATAKLIQSIPGTVFAAGDLAYQNGTYEEFENCYNPTWGPFKARTRPAPGNHEYNGSSANGYFRYWGRQAGDPEKGYYSYDLGRWHVVVLNTNCGVKAL